MGTPALAPVGDVWRIVKIVVAEEILRRIRSGFEKVFACPGEAQVVLVHILKASLSAMIAPGLVGCGDIKGACGSVIRGHRCTGGEAGVDR